MTCALRDTGQSQMLLRYFSLVDLLSENGDYRVSVVHKGCVTPVFESLKESATLFVERKPLVAKSVVHRRANDTPGFVNPDG
jgi:hypothetical protein